MYVSILQKPVKRLLAKFAVGPAKQAMSKEDTLRRCNDEIRSYRVMLQIRQADQMHYVHQGPAVANWYGNLIEQINHRLQDAIERKKRLEAE